MVVYLVVNELMIFILMTVLICLIVSLISIKFIINVECEIDSSFYWDVQWETTGWLWKQTEEIFIETLANGTTEDSWFLCETQNWGECPDDDWNACVDGFYLQNDNDEKQCISCSGDNDAYIFDWSLCCKPKFLT